MTLRDLTLERLPVPQELRGYISTREKLTANRTYYVRTDGSDSNDGLSDTAGGAFLTIAKALAVAAALDCSIYNVTIQVADGTYTGAVQLPKMTGSGTFTLTGNTTTPANVVISRTGGAAISATDSGAWAVYGFKVTTTTSGVGVQATGRTALTLRRIEFGSVAGAQLISASMGAIVYMNGSTYTISGQSTYAAFSASNNAMIQAYSSTFTITADLTFSIFVNASYGAIISSGSLTFALGAFTVTATRYLAELTGVIGTSGGGASYFPGDSAGSTATGGQYA